MTPQELWDFFKKKGTGVAQNAETAIRSLLSTQVPSQLSTLPGGQAVPTSVGQYIFGQENVTNNVPSPSKLAATTLSNLPALMPMAGGSVPTGYSIPNAIATGAPIVALQHLAGENPSDIYSPMNLGMMAMGGFIHGGKGKFTAEDIIRNAKKDVEGNIIDAGAIKMLERIKPELPSTGGEITGNKNAVMFEGDLFHGTSEENAKAILKSKYFKESNMSGGGEIKGADFGNGAYFSLDSGVSGNYGLNEIKASTTKPLKLYEANNFSEKDFVTKNWEKLKERGFDGAVFRKGGTPNVGGTRFDNEVVIFNPKGKIIPKYDTGQTLEPNAYSANQKFYNSISSGGEIGREGNPLAQLKAKQQLGPEEIVRTEPVINLKRDVPVTDIHGTKSTIAEGEALTPYALKGNKFILQDDQTYVINKNQYENIKGQSVKAEAKEFAPELKGTEETVKPSWDENTKTLGDVKYDRYTLPGGENYREVLIQTPENNWELLKSKGYTIDKGMNGEVDIYKNGEIVSFDDLPKNIQSELYKQEHFQSAHWDEPNVISHLRLNDRIYNGKKVTFMEEMQSDWAREGRSKGFADKIPEIKIEPVGNGKYSVYDAAYPNNRSEAVSLERANELKKNLQLPENIQKGVPNNPLLKNWQELSVKRGLKDAVDNGSDYFAWTTGEQQAARYNLSKQVNSIEWKIPDEDILKSWGKEKDIGMKQVIIDAKNTRELLYVWVDKTGKIIKGQGIPGDWNGKQLNEVIGKGIAEKIMGNNKGNLADEGLNIGGEWANTLYDKQVKNIVEDVTGGKVEMVDLGLPIDKSTELKVWKSGSAPKDMTEADLIIGKKIYKDTTDNAYIITDILGDGKFKAVPIRDWDRWHDVTNKDFKKRYPNLEGAKETFDISQKLSQQQAIRLTPEIKAKILGQAPTMKKPSGKNPLEALQSMQQMMQNPEALIRKGGL